MDIRQAYDAVSQVVSPVFLVGGSVRDWLSGRECNDFDFATPLDTDVVEARVRAAGRHPYLIGKKFGTVGFRLDGQIVEVTTFRAESYAQDAGRRDVTFLPELTGDLSHRDFTINAMALADGDVVDPFGGREDLKAGILRAVGSAQERFAEDPLRMLRAARFASQLDFEVDAATTEAIPDLAERLLLVARERWVAELDKLLVGSGAARALWLLELTGLMRYLLPEVHLLAALGTSREGATVSAFDRTLSVVNTVPADVTLRWAALLHDVARPYSATIDGVSGLTPADSDPLGPQLVERLALYLKWGNRRHAEVLALVRGQQLPDSPLRSAIDDADALASRP